jgi:hypothetical protein
VNTKERMTAESALHHPLITNNVDADDLAGLIKISRKVFFCFFLFFSFSKYYLEIEIYIFLYYFETIFFSS